MSGESNFAPRTLSITKIINNNVVVIIIVLSAVLSYAQVMFRFEDRQKQAPQHDHKQFSSVSALPQ